MQHINQLYKPVISGVGEGDDVRLVLCGHLAAGQGGEIPETELVV